MLFFGTNQITRAQMDQVRASAVTVLHDQECNGQLVCTIEEVERDENETGPREYFYRGWVFDGVDTYDCANLKCVGSYMDMLMQATTQMRADHDDL